MNDDVHMHSTPLDLAPNEPLLAVARAGAAAFGHTAELALDGQLAELLRLRVAQINNCTYCLDVHHRAARDAGIPQAKIDFPDRMVGDARVQRGRAGRAAVRRSPHPRLRHHGEAGVPATP
jgi:AhpD family alkylhydroperoxidase